MSPRCAFSKTKQQQQQAVASSQESLQLFTNRYKGVDTYLQVITAQTIELANERNAIEWTRVCSSSKHWEVAGMRPISGGEST
jgi:hypothetical protein